MGNKELRRLKRKDLLQMLLTQCEETERLQKELDGTAAELEMLQEGYERLKKKLDIKDVRLNQKDAKIAELSSEIEQIKASRVIELNEAGSIAEASLRLNGVFEAAQQAAEQYLMNVRRIAENVEPPVSEAVTEQKQILAAKTIPERRRMSTAETSTEQSAAADVTVSKAAVGGTAVYRTTGNKDSHETGWMAGIRKKQPRTRQIIPMNVSQAGNGILGDIHVR